MKEQDQAVALPLGVGEPISPYLGLTIEDEVVRPVLWKDRTIVAYSQTGFAEREIRIPSHWVDDKRPRLSLLTLDGLEERGSLDVLAGRR